MLLKKLLISLLFLSSSLTAFADHHTEDAQRITKEEKAKAQAAKIKRLANVIPFEGDFNFWTVDALIEEINDAVKEGDHTIIIRWNSGGGQVFAGYKLIHRIIQLQAKGIKFVGIVKNACMSMCFMTYQFMDVRLAYPLAILMDHPASGGPDHILKELTEIVRDNVHAKMRAAKMSPITIKLYDLLVLNEFYMNVRTAKGLGLLDMVILPGDERGIKTRKEVKKEVKKEEKKAVKK